jgi:hypothetical protein
MARKKPTQSRSKSNSYTVGYGRPPRRFQFKPGQSGNPSGIKLRPPSATADLRAALVRALNEKVTFRQGDRDEIITKAAAGIAGLVNQFAAGDRYARRDLMALAEKLGIDLTAGHRQAIESALEENLAAEDEDLLADFVQRHGGHYDRRDDSVGPLPRQKSNVLTLPLKRSNLPALPREDLDVVKGTRRT